MLLFIVVDLFGTSLVDIFGRCLKSIFFSCSYMIQINNSTFRYTFSLIVAHFMVFYVRNCPPPLLNKRFISYKLDNPILDLLSLLTGGFLYDQMRAVL